jgi:aminomethyltransferase
MTRFGMGPADFEELAGLMAAVIAKNSPVKEEVKRLRQRFLDLKYCFREEDYPDAAAHLRSLL